MDDPWRLMGNASECRKHHEVHQMDKHEDAHAYAYGVVGGLLLLSDFSDQLIADIQLFSFGLAVHDLIGFRLHR